MLDLWQIIHVHMEAGKSYKMGEITVIQFVSEHRTNLVMDNLLCTGQNVTKMHVVIFVVRFLNLYHLELMIIILRICMF